MQVIIFGGSGHLAMSKLVPALYNLNCNVHIILYGHSGGWIVRLEISKNICLAEKR